MKIVISLITVFIGYSHATTCTGTNTCDNTVTQCASGYTLTCLETSASDWHCVCAAAHDKKSSPPSLSPSLREDREMTREEIKVKKDKHACQVTDDCHNQHLHHCLKGHWACTNNHCHCTGGNHQGHAVG